MITPWPHQLEAFEALHKHMMQKTTNPCVVIPTGGGKSFCMAYTIQKWKSMAPYMRTIVLAHRQELVLQNATEMADASGCDIGIYCAGLKKRETANSVIYAMIDSVYKKWGEFEPFDLVIVDEAHRIPPDGDGKYMSFIKHCRSLNPKLRVVGFTATPYRMSGPICHADHVLQEICYQADICRLIREGHLCQLRSRVSDDQPDISGLEIARGEYNQTQVADLFDVPDVTKKAVADIAKNINAYERKSTLIFCASCQHCEHVASEVRAYGLSCEVINEKTPSEKRQSAAKRFIDGSLRVLCNVGIYTEGFNAKNVDCVVYLMTTASRGKYEQIAGRGLRIHPAKEYCMILDYGHNIETHGPIDAPACSVVRIAKCKACGYSYSRQLKACPTCGEPQPKREIEEYEREEMEEAQRALHEARAAKLEILSAAPAWYDVDDVFVTVHRKDGKPPSLKIQYRCGCQIFPEWVCLDHTGSAGALAKQWWTRRFGLPVPCVAEAIGNMLLGHDIKEITPRICVCIEAGTKYYKIIDHKLVRKHVDV